MFRLSSTPLDLPALAGSLDDLRGGAVVTFEGRVRNHNEGQPVLALDYEAYPALAEKEGTRILAEAGGKFAILRALCVHRTGHLQLGEIAVWVGVAAAHRDAAFAACRYIIDETKARVPIWKKEHYASGATEWINCATRADAPVASDLCAPPGSPAA
jgi:molybdopterin synthase catalytic subunit